MRSKINFDSIKKVFFIGIGGIGMSALARFLNEKKNNVFGYDRVETSLTRKLVEEGMKIHYDDDPIWIPEGIDLVIYTPAIPEDHKELNWFLSNGFPVYKRSKVLGEISKLYNTIAVAGTHGKTSTSALITHILKYTGVNPNAFLGGILVNYDSNYLGGNSKWMVVEADEYDRSFHRLSPNVLVITSMDADHLDVYGDHEEMIEAYRDLIMKIEAYGQLIIHESLMEYLSEKLLTRLKKRNVEVISFGESGDVRFDNVSVVDHVYVFDFYSATAEYRSLKSRMPGIHNIKNATAALAAIAVLDLEGERVRAALDSFAGIKRRFEKVHEGTFVLIDDYAHHPEELKYAIETLLRLYEGKEITVIFQPHLYSRTRDFYKGFGEQLSRVDHVMLMPIYPARELPIEGVTSKIIYDLVNSKTKELISEQNIINKIKDRKRQVVVTLGAADLDKYHSRIISAIEINE